MKLKNIITIFGAASFLWSCVDDSKEEETVNDFKITDILVNAADNIILPQFKDLKESVTELESAYTAFESESTSDNLLNLQNKHKESYSLWQSCSFVNYGNTNLITLSASLNTYPTDIEKVNVIFEKPEANLESGSYTKAIGFPGLDYLLFEGSDEEIIDRVSNEGSVYCFKNINLIKTKVETAYSFWTDDTDGFYSDFKTKSSTSDGSPFSSFLNGFVKNVEVLKNGQLGFPAGVFTLNVPDPTQSEALYSGISIQLYKEHLANLERVYKGQHLDGTDGKGLDDYLKYLGTTRELDGETENLNELILGVFSTLKQKADLLTGTINEAIGSQKEITDELYQKTKELVAYLKVDMMYAFKVQITYQDSDGD
jgi:predicted lipoprotein